MSDIAEKIRRRITIDQKGCWIWQGPKLPKGYGVLRAKEKTLYAHRVMYENAFGAIPEGMQIDHLCRNPPCCNPAHLEAVTPAENTRRGESPRLARLRGGQKTHCPLGHEYDDGNSYFDRRGYRSCRQCRAIRHAEWDAKRKARAAVRGTLTAVLPRGR